MEDAARVRHQAYRLQQAVRPLAAIDAGAACRSAIERPGLAALSTATKRELLGASAALGREGPRAGLVRFVEGAVFQGLAPEAKQVVLALVRAAGPRASELFAALEVVAPALPGLAARVQTTVLAAAVDRVFAAVLFKVAKHPAFRGLPVDEAIELVAYLEGPRLSPEIAPMRKNRMELLWLARRREVVQLLVSPRFAGASVDAQRAELREHLSAPVGSVAFLTANEVNGHTLVVFGSPSDPKALSYGRRWVLDPARRPIARTSSPDPSHASGWQRPERDATTTYAVTTVHTSRRDEWKLISWIEQSYTLLDDLRARHALGPTKLGGDAASFVDATLAALLRLVSGLRPALVEHGYVRAGRPLSPTKPDAEAEADRLLAAYLSA